MRRVIRSRRQDSEESAFVDAMRQLRLLKPWDQLGEHESFEVHACCHDGPLARMCFIGATFEKRGVAIFWDDCAYPAFLAKLAKTPHLDSLPASCSVLYFTEGRRVADPDLPLTRSIGPTGQPCDPGTGELQVIHLGVQALPIALANRLTSGPFHWHPVRIRARPRDHHHWIELRPGAPRLRAL